MKICRFTFLVCLCIAWLPVFAQMKSKSDCPGTVWKNRVQRVVYIDTAVGLSATDTSLAEILCRGILTGEIQAYSTYDDRFTTKITAKYVRERITPERDINDIYDREPGGL